MPTYKGRFTPKNIEKYKGDAKKIVYRSLWERQVMRWLDNNDKVIKWNSEEVVIGYICKTDNKPHRYFMDFWFKLENGKEYLVEVKPKKQTIKPESSKRKTKNYLNEVLTYVKNTSKWEAAQQYANKKNMIFQIWHEDVLKNLGIKIL